MNRTISFAEASARQRVAHLVDAGSFVEWLPPSARRTSPHLQQLGLPAALDDGAIVGEALLAGRRVLVAAQEGGFIGGGVGEVHGAKLTGLFRVAAELGDRPVLLLADSGGVRLHEANAGLIAVPELMRALLEAREAGVNVVALIGGANGCFGGMGIATACADRIVMSDVARWSMSGPEVIESSNGVEEFDSRDRALIWRTTGGRNRYLSGDCDVLVEDDMAAFRTAAIGLLDAPADFDLQSLERDHAQLAERLQRAGEGNEALTLWTRLGVADAQAALGMDVAELVAAHPQPTAKEPA